ncbi:MAG: hypothetical protein Kow0025_10780 [Thermodesulfovibrionales bacterium]
MTIGVAGSGAAGMARLLLERLEGWGAIRFTPSELYSSVADGPGGEGGEGAVLLVSAAPEDTEETLGVALARLSHLRGVVVEGDVAIEVLRPDIVIFIAVSTPGSASGDAPGLMAASDVVVFDKEIPPGAPERAAKFPIGETASCVDYIVRAVHDKGH